MQEKTAIEIFNTNRDIIIKSPWLKDIRNSIIAQLKKLLRLEMRLVDNSCHSLIPYLLCCFVNSLTKDTKLLTITIEVLSNYFKCLLEKPPDQETFVTDASILFSVYILNDDGFKSFLYRYQILLEALHDPSAIYLLTDGRPWNLRFMVGYFWHTFEPMTTQVKEQRRAKLSKILGQPDIIYQTLDPKTTASKQLMPWLKTIANKWNKETAEATTLLRHE